MYIETILNQFSLSNTKPCTMPIIPGTTYRKSDMPTNATEAAYMAKVPYYKAIGSLMYVTVATQPDIIFAISTLL